MLGPLVVFTYCTVAIWTTSPLIRRLPKTAISVHSVTANTAIFRLIVSRVVGSASRFITCLFARLLVRQCDVCLSG